jgi:hypothetical protein
METKQEIEGDRLAWADRFDCRRQVKNNPGAATEL